MTAFRAAAVQMRSGLSVEANVTDAEQLIREAVRAGANYVLTPEMTTLLDLERERLLSKVASEADDRSLARLRALAAELGVHIHIGSMAVKLDVDAVANRSYLIGPDGTILARYDKIHMFDVDLGGGESYRESRLYRPGQTAVVADLPWCRLGLSICYDLRFPVLYRTLAVAGAHVIVVPAAFTKVTGEAHWHVLIRARAIETGCFVVAAAQGGHHEIGRDTYGHSMIVDPWGVIIAEADIEPGYIIAEIDLDAVMRVRDKIPALTNARPFAPPAPADRASLTAA